MLKNDLIKKLRLISKLLMSSTGKQLTTIHILPKILKNKDDQKPKFGLLVEYKIENISLKTLHTKYGGETSPRPITKRSKLSISLYQHSEIS